MDRIHLVQIGEKNIGALDDDIGVCWDYIKGWNYGENPEQKALFSLHKKMYRKKKAAWYGGVGAGTFAVFAVLSAGVCMMVGCLPFLVGGVIAAGSGFAGVMGMRLSCKEMARVDDFFDRPENKKYIDALRAAKKELEIVQSFVLGEL